MSDFLAEVSERTRQRIRAQKSQVSLEQIKRRIAEAKASKPFGKSLHKGEQVALIAELKQASPSAGIIRIEEDIPQRIKAYAKGGASALSILTEEHYFHGSPQFLEETRALTSLPIVRKDFIMDAYQIYESRGLGADAILLISSLLTGGQLGEFIALAKEVGLETLVEVHDDSDVKAALAAKAPVIGINNRNLRTLKVDVKTGQQLLSMMPKEGLTLVVESGIKAASELPALKALGAHAVLIGETFMRAKDPEQTVKEFAHACQK